MRVLYTYRFVEESEEGEGLTYVLQVQASWRGSDYQINRVASVLQSSGTDRLW